MLLKYCFDYLGMHRVWLCVLDTNEVGIKLYVNSGFKLEGKYREAIWRDGGWHDYIVMSLLEGDYRA
jgi:RimJ/RimL family protein N-acetyltransferase